MKDETAPTLGYAKPSAVAAALINVRPIALIVPNLLAVVVIFLTVSGEDAPITPVVDYVKHFWDKSIGSDVWETFITGPFLLAIPLLLWTIRLSIRPIASRFEIVVAWCMTASALAMTLLAAGYCASLIPRERGFVIALAATLVILAATAWAVWFLRHLLRGYPPALLAMTMVYCANATLTILVVKRHEPWNVGLTVASIAAFGQFTAMGMLMRRWRGLSHRGDGV